MTRLQKVERAGGAGGSAVRIEVVAMSSGLLGTLPKDQFDYNMFMWEWGVYIESLALL
jgi:hypothetical protein